jgi:hypothetical protein
VEVPSWLGSKRRTCNVSLWSCWPGGERASLSTAPMKLAPTPNLMKPVNFGGLLGHVRQLGFYWVLLAEMPDLDNP